MPNLEGKITSNELSADLLALIGNGGGSGGSGSAYKVDIPSYDWAVDGSLRSINVRHSLGGEVLFVSAYDTSTKENIFLSYKIIDNNNIKLYNATAVNTTVIISANGKFNGIELTSNINDANVATNTTWSSSKTKSYVDTNAGGGAANKVSFNNSSNGMTATNVQAAIEENKTNIDGLKLSVSNGKTLVAQAVTGKGVPTVSTDTFETIAANINSINSHELIEADNPYFYAYLARSSEKFLFKNDFDTFGVVAQSKNISSKVFGGYDGVKSRLFCIEGGTNLKEIDTDTFAVINTTTMPKSYKSLTIGFDGVNPRVFVSNGNVGSGLYEVDINTFDVIATFPQSGICYNISLNYINTAEGGRLVVLNKNGGFVDEYDTNTTKLLSHTLIGHNNFTSYALECKNGKKKVFACSTNMVFEVDFETHSSLAGIPFLFSNTNNIEIVSAFETSTALKYNNELYYKN